MNKIKAKLLATGDRVRFSRDGWQTVGRITNSNSISVSFMFSDGIIRKLEANQEYVVEPLEKPPETQPGQIMRLNRESNRISVCASHSLFDLSDISESFRAIKQKRRLLEQLGGISRAGKRRDASHSRCGLLDASEMVWRGDQREVAKI